MAQKHVRMISNSFPGGALGPFDMVGKHGTILEWENPRRGRSIALSRETLAMIGSSTSSSHLREKSGYSSIGSSSSTKSATAASSSSSQQSDPLSQLFGAVDGDASGGVSAKELQSFIDTMSKETRGALLSVQENGASSASATEGHDPSAQTMAALDTDGDGGITQAELETALSATPSSSTSDEAASLIEGLDTDGDGAVSQAELTNFMKANMPSPPPPMASASTSGSASASTSASASGSGSASSSSSDSASNTFDAIDTNKDGEISKAELDAYLAKTEASGPSASSSGSSSSSTTSSTDASSSFASIMAQMLQQSYQRMQTSQTEQQSTLLESIDAVA